MITATATDVQNNFGHFLQAVQSGDEIISFLTDSLTGVLKSDYDDKAIRAERIEAHESID